MGWRNLEEFDIRGVGHDPGALPGGVGRTPCAC